MNHRARPNRSPFQLGILFSLTTLLTACALNSAEPLPTRTPAPTFTATAISQDTPVDPAAVAATQAAVQTEQTAQPVQPASAAQNTPVQAPASQPVTTTQTTDTGQVAQPAVEPTATSAPPTPSPTSAKAQVIIASPANVRGGPGITYNILGAATVGQQYDVLGKNPQGDWWQINFNGAPGWVFGQLVSPLNTGAVAVAQNIPAPPPPTAIPPTQPPPPPPPTQPPAAPPAAQPPVAAPPQPPAAPAAKKYKFNIVVVSRCQPQEGGNWFEGKTYINGQPTNGYKVVFSYAPDGPAATPPLMSGPHDGYTNWDAGYYSHIINAAGPQAGNWFAWVVDDAGARISEIGNFTFKGAGGDCNQAVVDFDSR